MTILALEGQLLPVEDSQTLRRRVAELEEELESVRDELKAERTQTCVTQQAAAVLRKQLEPLHLALRVLFGELDSIPTADAVAANNSAPSDARRQLWEQRIKDFNADSLKGKMLTALLNLGPMTASQLRVPMGCVQNSVYNAYDKLQRAGLVVSIGGKYQLKEL